MQFIPGNKYKIVANFHLPQYRNQTVELVEVTPVGTFLVKKRDETFLVNRYELEPLQLAEGGRRKSKTSKRKSRSNKRKTSRKGSKKY